MDIRYSKIIVVIFMTLIYSPGLPLLYFLGFMYFFLLYWLEKWWLFKVCKTPSNFDSSL